MPSTLLPAAPLPAALLALLALLALGAGPARAQGTNPPTSAIPGALLPGAAAPAPGLPGTGLPDTGLPGTGLPGLGTPAAGLPGLGSGSDVAPAAPAPANPGARIYTGTGLPPLPGSIQPFTCPTVHGGRLLVASDVYDGSPLRGSLMPSRNGKWSLPPHNWPGNAYFISCEYGYDRPPLGIRLPQRVRVCKRPTDDPTQVACR